MALKTYKPVTNAQRQLVLVDRSGLHKGAPVKALTEGQSRNAGRNNTGRVVVRWQGGGHKQRYRVVDFKRGKHDMPAIVERLSREAVAAIQAPDARERLAVAGVEPIGTTPAQMGEFINREFPRWEKLLTQLGLRGKP